MAEGANVFGRWAGVGGAVIEADVKEASGGGDEPVVGGIGEALRVEAIGEESVELIDLLFVLFRGRPIVGFDLLPEVQDEAGVPVDHRGTATGGAVGAEGGPECFADEDVDELAEGGAAIGLGADGSASRFDHVVLGYRVFDRFVLVEGEAVFGAGGVVDGEREAGGSGGDFFEEGDDFVSGQRCPERERDLNRVGTRFGGEGGAAGSGLGGRRGATDHGRSVVGMTFFDSGAGDAFEFVQVHGEELSGRSAGVDARNSGLAAACDVGAVDGFVELVLGGPCDGDASPRAGPVIAGEFGALVLQERSVLGC